LQAVNTLSEQEINFIAPVIASKFISRIGVDSIVKMDQLWRSNANSNTPNYNVILILTGANAFALKYAQPLLNADQILSLTDLFARSIENTLKESTVVEFSDINSCKGFVKTGLNQMKVKYRTFDIPDSYSIKVVKTELGFELTEQYYHQQITTETVRY
jgi:hypothetical protein